MKASSHSSPVSTNGRSLLTAQLVGLQGLQATHSNISDQSSGEFCEESINNDHSESCKDDLFIAEGDPPLTIREVVLPHNLSSQRRLIQEEDYSFDPALKDDMERAYNQDTWKMYHRIHQSRRLQQNRHTAPPKPASTQKSVRVTEPDEDFSETVFEMDI